MNSDTSEFFETYGDYLQYGVKTMYSATIHSYDATTRKAQVEINGAFESDVDVFEKVPILTDINVGMPLAGGFFISLPIKAGDTGRLCIFSQDIDSIKGVGGNPDLKQEHGFEWHNSIFIPDFNPFNKSIPNHHADNLVIGKYDSGVTLTLTSDDNVVISNAHAITYNADYEMRVNTPTLVISGNLKVGSGANGTFGTTDGFTVTVADGIITNIS